MTGAALGLCLGTPPPGAFGGAVVPILLDEALRLLEHGHGSDRQADALIFEALGWLVDRAQPRRRLPWRCRAPLSRHWDALPSPTGDERAAALLVPWRWSWSAGVVDGQPRAWCREDRPRRGQAPRFSECNRLTVARALAAAALFAHRQLVMEAMGHG